MGIEFVKDERDKRAADPLRVPERPGFVRRWVRTKGYDAEGHMAKRREQGYVPVAQTPATADAGGDPRLTGAHAAQLDTTIKRGDLMLMECPEERVAARRKAQQELTERRTRGVTERMQAELADDPRGRRRK